MILEDNKKIYESVANSVLPNWQNTNKNELVFEAVKCTNPIKKDAYISAIILKYWNKMIQYCYKTKLVATPEDVHSWLTAAVMYAIDNQPWNNPNSSIYQDKNGPDKVINRCMESRRVTYYQQLNRYNRKINGVIDSLDSLIDDYKDVFTPSKCDDYIFCYDETIKNYFNKEDYFVSFLLFIILYEDIVTANGFNKRKLFSYLRNLDDDLIKRFSKKYDFSEDKVREAASTMLNFTNKTINKKIEYNLLKLKLYHKEEF